MMLAVDLGYLPNTLRGDLHQMMMKIQNSHMQVLEERVLNIGERDIKRAELLREFFATVPNLKFD
jgi:protein-arginine kinase